MIQLSYRDYSVLILSFIMGKIDIDWKNQSERKAFEEAFNAHRNRHKDKTGCEKFTWFFTVFILNGCLIIAMYGSAAYILMNEAWDTKTAEELKMKEAWIAQRQVTGSSWDISKKLLFNIQN